MTLSVAVIFVSTFVLAVVAAWGLVNPFFDNTELRPNEASKVKSEQLRKVLEREELLLRELEEIEQDFLAKKIEAADYQSVFTELSTELQVIREDLLALQKGNPLARSKSNSHA